MKSVIYLFTCFPIILGSCSAYQRVALDNFKEYNISFEERGNLQYVLKKHKLHFSVTDATFNSNYFGPDKTVIYKDQEIQMNDNIIIPMGANGVCVNTNDDNFIIDFGEGVLVTFIVYGDDNGTKSEIEVEERRYSLEQGSQRACLYFETRELKRLE